MIKRLFAILLALAMLASLCSFPALAAEEADPALDAGPTLHKIHVTVYRIESDDSWSAGLGGSAYASATDEEPGKTVTVSVFPDPGYRVKWVKVGDGIVSGTDIKDDMYFYMPDYDAFVDVFFERVYDVIVTPYVIDPVTNTFTAYAGGMVSASVASAAKGDAVQVSAYPDAGYRLNRIEYGNGMVTGTDITDVKQFSMPDYTTFVDAFFELIPTYNLTVNVTPAGAGKVMCTCDPTIWTQTIDVGVVEGAYELTARAEDGWTFSYWELGGSLLTSNTTFTFLMNGEISATAVFKKAVAPTVSIASDAKTAKVAGDFANIYARIAFVLDSNGESGLYVTQGWINDDGTIIIPTFDVPGLTVKGVNVTLVGTISDISASTPKVLDMDYKFF